MTLHDLRLASRLVAAIVAVPLLAGAAQGDLMSITTTSHMDMPGAPPQVAAMMNRTFTRKQCMELARRTDPTIWNENRHCTASNVHQSATEVSAHLVCERGMVADVDVHFLPGGDVHGIVHLNGNVNGMRMTGEETIDGRRIGSCNPDEAH